MGLTVIAASVHGLLRPTCNSHKVLALDSAETKNAVDSGDINISRTSKSRDCKLREKLRNLAPKS